MQPIVPTAGYDIFISHSHQDGNMVEEVRNYLESRGLKCWVSSRVEDNPAGINYMAQITNSIKAATIFVVVLTSHANHSQDVAHETAIAFNNKKCIIPFLPEWIDINPTLTYALVLFNPVGYFKSSHLERLERLYKSCLHYLQQPVQKAKRPGLLNVMKTALRKPGLKWSTITILTAIAAFGLYAAFNYGNLWTRQDTFSVTVFVHGKKGRDDRILKNQGQVMLALRSSEIPCSINEKGEATFKELPIGLKDTPVLIRIYHPQPYRAIHPDSLYHLQPNAAIYLEVALEGINRVFGHIKDFHTEQWLDSVRVSIENYATYTDKFGWFELNIPEDKQRKFQKLSFYKKGYHTEELDSIPVHTQQAIDFSLKKGK